MMALHRGVSIPERVLEALKLPRLRVTHLA